MRKGVLALMLLGSSVSAQAVTYVGEIKGTVTSSFATIFTASDAIADIEVGDTITARFTYAGQETGGSPLGDALGHSLASMMTDEVSFELGGHRWSSRGAFLAGLVPTTFGPAEDPFQTLYLTMDDAPGAGDLHVEGYAFEIGEFGYDLYQGYGYAGSFDRGTLKVWGDGLQLIGATPNVTPVPEAATWALMISGFGLAGAALRRRRRVAVSFG